MKSKRVLLIACFVLVFLGGVAVMRVWDVYHIQQEKQPVIAHKPSSMTFINFKNATVPDGVAVIEDDKDPIEDTASSLVKIHVPELDYIVSKSGNTIVPEENEAEESRLHTIPDQVPTKSIGENSEDEMKTNISMIEVPVSARLITNSNEYKEFKKIAKGSYPETNFKEHNILVLESMSNLPDKVFEIKSVQEVNGKMLVTYRVSVFGLDKKINSHSAVLIYKRDLPIELKQVL